ncbi:hypothetical protein BJY00DRAFT_314974 [Aspergillus carlsbadensis]|nr:hypothetical protein BJY00DRAFT_314974 [Aspergillus carlsbadensis]
MNPHISPQHHPSTRPGEGPHPAYNSPTGSRNADRLADQLSQLHIHQDRHHEARPRSFNASAEVVEDTDLFYVGYTFFKAPAAPGHNATWNKVEKSRMNLSQNDLSALVQKKAKRKSVADQYQGLRLIRRTHVDDLIEELREVNPQYHWTCVYVKEEERNVRRKGYPRNSYETSSMDIILEGKALRPSGIAEIKCLSIFHSIQATSLDLSPEGATPSNGEDQLPHMPTARTMPPFTSINKDPLITSHHFMCNHNRNHMPMACSKPLSISSNKGHLRLSRYPRSSHNHMPKYRLTLSYHLNTEQESQTTHSRSIGHRMKQKPIVHNHPNAGPAHSPRPGVQDQRPRGAARDPVSPNHRQEIPHQKVSHKQQAKAGKKRDKSPKHGLGSEPDLVYDTTSSDDDNILTPDFDGEDWETEFSERDTASKPVPWRGSLYRGQAPSERRRSHRQHYRKDPQRAADHRAGHYYRDDSTVDIIPASSSRTSRRLGRTHSGYRGTSRQYESQPKVMQEISAEDLGILMSQLRGHAHYAARGRMLNQWESELAEREEMLKYHQQMAARYEDNNYLGRSRSLRQPLAAYPHGYLQLR